MKRALVPLLLLAAALGGYLFGVELPGERRAQQRWAAESRVFDFSPEDVDSLQIRRADGVIVLARRPQGWHMVAPLDVDAMSGAVETHLAQLSSAQVVRVLADSVATENWSLYGLGSLDNGRRELRVTLRDGSVQVLYAGNESPDGGFAYARRADSDRLLLTERNLHQLSWARASAFRRVELFDVADSSITRVDVTGPRGSWSARRDDDGLWWQDDVASDLMFSRREMRQIAYDLASSNVRAFERRLEQGGWKAYGLDPAYSSIEWGDESGRHGRLEIGNEFDQNEVFARRNQELDLLRVARQLAEDSEVVADSLLDHNPLRFNFDRADSVVLRWIAGPRITLKRTGRRWSVAGVGAAARTGSETLDLAAKNLVFTLENMQSDRTWLLPAADSVEAVLEEVPLRIEVYRGSERARDLRLGWRGNGESYWLAPPSPHELYRIDRQLYIAARGLGVLSGRLDP